MSSTFKVEKFWEDNKNLTKSPTLALTDYNAHLKLGKAIPSIYLHLIFAIFHFEISNLMNWIFSQIQTWILQATVGRKIQFIKLNISNWRIAKIKCK